MRQRDGGERGSGKEGVRERGGWEREGGDGAGRREWMGIGG